MNSRRLMTIAIASTLLGVALLLIPHDRMMPTAFWTHDAYALRSGGFGVVFDARSRVLERLPGSSDLVPLGLVAVVSTRTTSEALSVGRNLLGHFHPALVHFPIAFLLGGAAIEAWHALRGRPVSSVGRTLIVLGLVGTLLALASGLALLREDDYQGRKLAAARVHQLLGFAAAGAATTTALLGGLARDDAPRRSRLALYRIMYFIAALLAGTAAHYGGWMVFGWGRIWTP